MQEYVSGYVRVSTTRQSVERQIRNILEYDSRAKIYKETHKRYDLVNRVEFKKLIRDIKKLAREGNKVTLIADAVDRFGSDDDCFAIYLQLYKLGVDLVFLKEPYANTEYIKRRLTMSKLPRTNSNVDFILEGVEKYLEEMVFLEVKAAFKRSQIEIDNIKLRVIDGIKTARLHGKQIGRTPLDKTVLPPEFFEKYEIWKKGDITKTQFALDMNWSRPKLDRMIKLSQERCITSKEILIKKYILKYHKDFDGSLDDTTIMKNLKLSRSSFYKYKKILKEEISACEVIK